MNPSTDQCPTSDQLSRLVQGQLADGEALPIAEHTERCSVCSETIHQFSRQHDPLAQLLRRPLRPELQQRTAEAEFQTAINRLLSSTHKEPASEASAGSDTDEAQDLKTTAFPDSVSPGRLDLELPESLGRYRLLRRLGRGGMGVVYLAEDSDLQREVALKVPFTSREMSRQVVERFRREARVAARLHHPNICSIFDVGEVDGFHYLTMAFIEGRLLSEELKGGRPLPVPRALEIVRQVAWALDYAHRRGIVHRDLKPANIMLDARGEPVVMDFGLARRCGAEEQLTLAGEVMGTPAYMAPEQLRGDSDAVTPACDIYGLGVILYVLLAGQPPFVGDVLAVASRIALEPPDPPSQLRVDMPTGVDDLCLKAMAKNPADRFDSMASLAQAVEQIERNGTAGQVFPTPQRAAVRGWQTRGWAAALLAPLLVLAGVTLHIATDRGTIIIESPDEDVQIEVRSYGGQERDSYRLKTGENQFSYHSGEYEVIVIGAGANELRIEGETVTLSRGGQARVRLYRQAAPPAGGPPAETPTLLPGGGQALESARSEPRAVPITELNLQDFNLSPWLSPDGLRIYWETGGHVQMAHRPDANSPFERPAILFPGRHPTLSADETVLVCLERFVGDWVLFEARRSAPTMAWGSRRPIQQLRSQPNVKSPSLSADGRSLYFQRGELGAVEIVKSSWDPSAESWSVPLPVAGLSQRELGPARDPRPTWPFFAEDELTVWFTLGGDSEATMQVARRASLEESFGEIEPVVVDGRPLRGRGPVHVAATRELFFAACVGSNDRPWELWVVKDYDPSPSSGEDGQF